MISAKASTFAWKILRKKLILMGMLEMSAPQLLRAHKKCRKVKHFFLDFSQMDKTNGSVLSSQPKDADG